MRKVAVPTAVASLLTVLAAGCIPESFGTRSKTADIHYEVRLRDGGKVPVTLRYRLPSGALREGKATTPWEGEPMTFSDGTQMLIEAETKEGVRSPLLCVLASEDTEEGAYVLSQGDELTSCSTHHRMGLWPPNDDDPIGNPLIRVG